MANPILAPGVAKQVVLGNFIIARQLVKQENGILADLSKPYCFPFFKGRQRSSSNTSSVPLRSSASTLTRSARMYRWCNPPSAVREWPTTFESLKIAESSSLGLSSWMLSNAKVILSVSPTN